MKRDVPKELLNSCGVYKITNEVNGQIYIGSTNNFRIRHKGHNQALRTGKYKCAKLQNSVTKYGTDNFTFSVLEATDDYRFREWEYIRDLKPELNVRTELSPSGDISHPKGSRNGMVSPMKGKKHSEESKALMSLQRKGLKPSFSNKGKKYNRVKKKQIKSLDLTTGEEIMHLSINDAVSHFGFGISSIYQCCLNQRNNVYNIKFSYHSL